MASFDSANGYGRMTIYGLEDTVEFDIIGEGSIRVDYSNVELIVERLQELLLNKERASTKPTKNTNVI